MGFWDFLKNVGNAPVEDPNVSYARFYPNVEYMGGAEWQAYVEETVAGVRGMSAAALWKTQPHLRTVVSFMARNVAQLGVHTFERVNETDRRRDRTNPFAQALAAPGDGMTRYRLIFALVGDKLLYDRAYWLPWMDGQGKWRIRRLPPSWVVPLDKTAFGVQRYKVTLPGGGFDIDATRLICFDGYSPTTNIDCSPTLDALKDTLAEQIESTLYRKQVWKRGGRTSSVIQRPLEAPPWTDEQAKRFREDWYANYTGDGPRAGGTPVLEDGMTIGKIDFSASDMQWAEGAKLAFGTVASAFHINPTMVGQLDNANYSNVREFRRMLYGDSLGPLLAELEDVFNTFALTFFDMDPERFYAEFNIAEKLQGSFEEQAAVMSTLVGRPIMTGDEGRARFNLPALGGDMERVVTPLNVLVGGQASPRDSGTQNQNPSGESSARNTATKEGTRSVKARAPETYEAKAAEVIGGFFKRQEQVLRSKLGQKAAGDWWDENRWNTELSTDLYALSQLVTGEVAAKTLDGIGFSPDAYDADRTLAWLQEVSDRSASSMNEHTKTLLQEALSADSPSDAIDSVFAAQESRATMAAVSTVTLLSGFATAEAAKQVAGDAATKTWVTGKNARKEHLALNGETVPLSENFSNGAAWPGDASALGADDLANCNCELQINVPEGS